MNIKHLLKPENAAALMREPWGTVSSTLNEISQSENWRDSHTSFTAWVKSFAEAAAVQESSLWRIISAGRYYSSLGTIIGTLKLPTLIDISKSATAEQLELVEKIGRVSSSTEVEKLIAGIIDGSLTRDRLRTRWRVYRDSESNKTNATLTKANTTTKVVLPKNNRREIQSFDVVERLLITMIENQPVKDWIGIANPHFIKTFYRPPVTLSGDDKTNACIKFQPDLLVIIQEVESSPVLFHIIEPMSYRRFDSLNWRKIANIARMYADFFWLAVEDKSGDSLLIAIPEEVGLITFSSSGIILRQQPKLSKYQNIRSGELAKLLLTKVL